MSNSEKEIIENLTYIKETFNLESTKTGLSTYIIYRSFLIFLVLVNYNWVTNLPHQLNYFFGIHSRLIRDTNFIYYFSIPLSVIISLSFITLVHLSIKIGFLNALKKINFKNFQRFIILILTFFKIAINNDLEIERKNRFTPPFIIFSFIVIIIINGCPLINNYKAVYFECSSGDYTISKKTYVFTNNTSTKLINSIMNEKGKTIIEEGFFDDNDNYFDDNLSYDWTSTGYLFKQTANIEGFNIYREYKDGLSNYFSSLIYFIIEKLIVTIIYFITPFIVTIGIYSYRKKTNSV